MDGWRSVKVDEFAQMDLKKHRWLIVAFVAGLIALVFVFSALTGHIRVAAPILQ